MPVRGHRAVSVAPEVRPKPDDPKTHRTLDGYGAPVEHLLDAAGHAALNGFSAEREVVVGLRILEVVDEADGAVEPGGV